MSSTKLSVCTALIYTTLIEEKVGFNGVSTHNIFQERGSNRVIAREVQN